MTQIDEILRFKELDPEVRAVLEDVARIDALNELLEDKVEAARETLTKISEADTIDDVIKALESSEFDY